MQIGQIFESWGGSEELEPKKSIIADPNDFGFKGSAASFTPATIDQTVQQKPVGLNTGAVAFNPKAKPFVPGQSKS